MDPPTTRDPEGRAAGIDPPKFPDSYPPEFPEFTDVIGDPTLADAILDRVIHNAYKIALKGESRLKGKEDSEEP